MREHRAKPRRRTEDDEFSRCLADPQRGSERTPNASNCVAFMRFDAEFRQPDVCTDLSPLVPSATGSNTPRQTANVTLRSATLCVAGNSWQDSPHTPLHPGIQEPATMRILMRLISAFYPDVRIPRLTLFLLFRSLVSDASESRVIQRRLTKRGHLRRTANGEKFAAQHCQFYRA